MSRAEPLPCLLAVKASGLVTAVGFHSESTLAAIRAGLSGLRTGNLWDPETMDYLQAAKVDLPQWWEGRGKLAELVAPAIHECLASAAPTPPSEIPILLGVASASRPCRFVGLEDELLREVEGKLGFALHSSSRTFPSGNASVVFAIAHALALIRARKAPACVVACVDSFLQQSVIDAYLEERRIKTGLNSNGFIAGEAGTAVLVGPASPSSRDELLILATGSAEEKAIPGSDEPLRAEGMIAAVEAALVSAALKLADVDYRITDLNGEHDKFKEAALVEARLDRIKPGRSRKLELWHPVEYLGEIGAAIGPLALAQARHASLKGYAPGPVALLHFSDDSGARGAIVTRANDGGSR